MGNPPIRGGVGIGQGQGFSGDGGVGAHMSHDSLLVHASVVCGSQAVCESLTQSRLSAAEEARRRRFTVTRTCKRMMDSYPLVAAMFALVVWSLLLAACNTTQGAGKDIEKLGEGIQDAAESSK